MTTTSTDIGQLLREFGGNPQQAQSLARFLGFNPIPNPEEQLAGPLTAGIKQFFRSREDQFGVSEFYRVGSQTTHPSSAGLWVGVLSNWGQRSLDRDRARRRIARALVEQVPERRSLALLVPPTGESTGEAELIFPRTPLQDPDNPSSQTVTTVRALVDLNEPTRFHRDLLRDLVIPKQATLLEVSRLWQQHFSVERVANKFYKEYTEVRNRMADALRESNPQHPIVPSLTTNQARAWATRQMGRVLFLWFLQAKRWLGEPNGQGSPTYLSDLWNRRSETPEQEYYQGMLLPLFFDAMTTGSSTDGENALLGHIPYLNGGLFRRNALEDHIDDGVPVSLPDEVFDPQRDDSLLGLLSRYRFTTRESTPDDQSVDPDPELLGRVFENLYQGDERHDTGTYYTPREIVHFMCRQALDGYLRDQVPGLEQETLDTLREMAIGSRDEAQTETLNATLANSLVDALETVRVCDPAVGSGAFLLGTLQEIVALRRGILFSQRDYVSPEELYEKVSEWKRRIVTHNLHGVDINAEAIEICQLRLWLSMVLDVGDPPRPNEGWALPNLDFRIIAGDSLADRVAGIAFKESWPTPPALQIGLDLQNEIGKMEHTIARRKEEFDGTHRDPKRLRELRDHINHMQRQIVGLHLTDALAKAQGELQMRKGVKRGKNSESRAQQRVDQLQILVDRTEGTDFGLVQKPFLWPLAFPEVLHEDDTNSGFDIVLANPPYVRQEKLDPDDQKSYAESFPEVHVGTADLLVYFYARAIQLLRPGGWMSFISSNKFMRAGYGNGIREHLTSELAIQKIVDLGDLPLFDANGKPIAAYPVVIVGKRSNDSDGCTTTIADLAVHVRQQLLDSDLNTTPENVRGVLENLDHTLVQASVEHFPQALLRRHGWVLEEPDLVRLFERLMNKGTPLGEFLKGRIYYGVKTGLNQAFEINQSKRNELIEKDNRSSEIIKPWLRGRNIKRWKPDWAEQYVIFTRRGIDIDQYSAVKEHLSQWRESLEPKKHSKQLGPGRKPGDYKWYEIQDTIAYYQEFAFPKVIFSHFINSPSFAYDLSGAYHNNACSFIVPPSPSVAAIVNSKIGWWLLWHLSTLLQNGYLQLFDQFLTKLPIPALSKEADDRLSELVNALALGVELPEAELEIESIVAQAFGLSQGEQALLSRWSADRDSAYKRSDVQDDDD